jgi:hypothetical protein
MALTEQIAHGSRYPDQCSEMANSLIHKAIFGEALNQKPAKLKNVTVAVKLHHWRGASHDDVCIHNAHVISSCKFCCNLPCERTKQKAI